MTRPATDRQRAYATELGITLPADADTQRASDYITHALNGSAPAGLTDYAQSAGVELPTDRPISTNLITRLIRDHLGPDDYARAALTWWIASVIADRQKIEIEKPADLRIAAPVMESWLATFSAQERAMRSWQRIPLYGDAPPIQIWTFAAEIHDGESRRTQAYKAAADLAHLPRKKSPSRPKKQHESSSSSAKYWPWIIAITVLIIILAALI